jgi:hypothetical protein
VSPDVDALLAAASALLLIGSGLWGCQEAPPDKPKRAESTLQTAVATLRPPPPWLPPNYTEIPWPEVVTLIQSQEVDRVLATRTRRVYVVKRGGDKRYTTAPRLGEVAELVAQIPRNDRRFLYRDDIQEISWAEAESLVRSRQATSISMSHFNMVSLNVKGGGYPLAIAPSEKDVGKLIDEVDPSLLGTIE